MIDKKDSDQRSIEINEYLSKSYEELSKEFKQLFPAAVRAYRLIPLMYNRLTLIDNLSHSDAWKKIISDHKEIPGFSERNVRRYLPSDNPAKPHRVVPSRPKNSITEKDLTVKVSDTKLPPGQTELDCKRSLELEIRNKRLENASKVNAQLETEKEFKFSIKLLEIKMYLVRRKLANSVPKEIPIIARIDVKGGVTAMVDDSPV